MSKQLKKASSLVSRATITFDLAVQDVTLANELLTEAIAADENLLKTYELEITSLYKKIDAIQADKIQKESQIKTNLDLISKLGQFTTGGKN